MKYREKEVYKSKGVRLYVVLNEERRQGDCSSASDSKLRFSSPLSFFLSLPHLLRLYHFFSFLFFFFQLSNTPP